MLALSGTDLLFEHCSLAILRALLALSVIAKIAKFLKIAEIQRMIAFITYSFAVHLLRQRDDSLGRSLHTPSKLLSTIQVHQYDAHWMSLLFLYYAADKK